MHRRWTAWWRGRHAIWRRADSPWVRSELALAHGDPERALQMVDALVAVGARRDATDPDAAQRSRVEALHALHRFDAAATVLEAAQRAATEQGARPLLWQVHRSLGRLWHAARDEARAQAEYAAARAVIAALAVTIDDAAVRDAFATTALGSMPKAQPRAPGPRARDAFGGLTAREYEVAALVATGKTNREIAALLFVSEGTVATHVKHILAKLELTSRTQVATWMLGATGRRHADHGGGSASTSRRRAIPGPSSYIPCVSRNLPCIRRQISPIREMFGVCRSPIVDVPTQHLGRRRSTDST